MDELYSCMWTKTVIKVVLVVVVRTDGSGTYNL